MEKKLIKKIYNKVPITIEQQINLLNKKGLLIDNKQTAYAFLNHVSYLDYEPTLILFKITKIIYYIFSKEMI